MHMHTMMVVPIVCCVTIALLDAIRVSSSRLGVFVLTKLAFTVGATVGLTAKAARFQGCTSGVMVRSVVI